MWAGKALDHWYTSSLAAWTYQEAFHCGNVSDSCGSGKAADRPTACDCAQC